MRISDEERRILEKKLVLFLKQGDPIRLRELKERTAPEISTEKFAWGLELIQNLFEVG